MLKKIGIGTMALAGMLAFAAPRPADAKVRFGVSIGAPAYAYPAAPYAYPPYYYGYPPAYVAPYYAPSYSFGLGFGGSGHGHHEIHGHEAHGVHGRHR